MKKITLGILIASVLVLSVGLIAAVPLHGNGKGNGYAQHVVLVEKVPYTWEVIPGAWGKLTYNEQGRYAFNAHKLADGEFTLITYGGWSNVACFGTSEVNEEGDFHLEGSYDFELMSDEPEVVFPKVWLVPSSNVNCEAGKMVSWNPTSYLFEY